MTSTSANNVNNIPPAIAINLSGQYLIEASAGTGKTWTLTGIVLRLLIEGRRSPEHIICTTFTRAATAEMQERILVRLHDFYELLLWIEKISGQPSNRAWLYLTPEDNDDISEKDLHDFQYNREQKIIPLAKSVGYHSIEDPINVHLVHHILNSYQHNPQEYPLSLVIRRIELLQISMDKLFVGTLDSLAQKWLSEYSAETGYQQGMTISEYEQEMISDIIHDQLRTFQASTYHNQPLLYNLLEQTGKLTGVDDHVKSVRKALQFISTPVDEVTGFDFTSYQRLINRLAIHDMSDVRPYFDQEYCKKQGFRAGTVVFKNMSLIEDIFHAIREYQVLYCLHLTDEHHKFLVKLEEVILDPDEKHFGFKKNKDKEREAFIHLESIQGLHTLYELTNTLDDEINFLNYQIIQSVRYQLPLKLDEQNQTTFSLQMVGLNKALQGHQGKVLARYIRHQYPIALIDESQDINSEQAKMLQAIYLPQSNTEEDALTRRNFLLLVGDPKQAIYGFRGGDVANYNDMKAKFMQDNQFSLSENRRSHQGLVQSLNEWFGVAQSTETSNSQKFDHLGEGISYQLVQAFREQSRLCWDTTKAIDADADTHDYKALSVIQLPYKSDIKEESDKHHVVAQHILTLLTSQHTFDGRPIVPSDIAILARTKKDLQQMQWALEKVHIPTVKVAELSVFSSQMAEDLLVVLHAILSPFNSDVVNRALSSYWYGLSIEQIKRLTDTPMNDVGYYDFQQHLYEAQQKWIDFGVMSALQFLFNKPHFSSGSIWEQLASYADAERYLLDLRQLLDLLIQYSSDRSPMHIVHWLSQQNSKKPRDENSIQHAIPTESGVKLMSIHKSKGLEFAIVYVFGMDNNAKRDEKSLALYPYLKHNTRRLSVVKSDKHHDYEALMNGDNFDEEKRIAYVALTRASEQAFIVVKDKYNIKDLKHHPVNLWLESHTKEYTLPPRLENTVDWFTSVDILAQAQGLGSYQNILATHDNEEQPITNFIEYPNYYQVMKQRWFIGWEKTSFTALSRQFADNKKDIAIAEPDYLFEQTDIEDNPLPVLTNNTADHLLASDDIRFSFVRGASAGTFLHQILERIDFNHSDRWTHEIDRGLQEYGLPSRYTSASTLSRLSKQGLDECEKLSEHAPLTQWLQDILQTPLLSSGVCLKDIDKANRKAELGFDMGLSETFNVKAINDVLGKHLDLDGVDKDKRLNFVDNQQKQIYRYLRGEIDLVYQQAGKYYVVDYKSNHLGNTISDYDSDSLNMAMGKAGYWLQAMIYQVALHRLLTLRLKDYQGNESQYLGAVEYLFVRGCIAGDNQYGTIIWDIPIELVKDMDELFGS